MSIRVKTGKVERENPAPCLWLWRCVESAVYWDAAAVRKVGMAEEVWEDAHPGLLGLTLVPRVSTGVLWHPEGPHRELAVPDLRPRCSAQVSAVPQEGRGAEAHPERDKMGPR